MNRDTIKYIAMFTMLLNHIANIFLEPGTLWFEILVDVGYFTAITMCYFLVEGYGYTRSKEKYGKRLLLFAVLSQLPFHLAFAEEGVRSFTGMNMIFTLFLCFLILYVREKIPEGARRNLCILGLILVSLYSDWALLAPLFTLWFAQREKPTSQRLKAGSETALDGLQQKRRSLWIVYGKAMFLFGLLNFVENSESMTILENLLDCAGAEMGILLSGICIIYFYNGKRARKGQQFSKWFFYLFYPVHLLILGMLKRIVLPLLVQC